MERKRTFNIDVERCDRCGGRMKLRALVITAYWTDESGGNAAAGSVVSAPIQGGSTRNSATGLTGPGGGLVLDKTNIYWTEKGAGKVMKVPKAGGTPMTLASNQGAPVGMAVDSESVYWANNQTGTVMKVPIAGGMITTLATGQDRAWYVAVDSTSLYWTNQSGKVMKLTPK